MQLVKYSASGNDFVIYHTFVKKDRSELAKLLCHRHEGIGADGLIVLLPHSRYDFEWQFYNADGSEAEMCGNGSRAAAHYAYSYGLASKQMRFLTLAGVIEASVEADVVESQLTKPKILDRKIEENGKRWWLIDTGVPHLVTFVEDLNQFDKNESKRLRNKYNANVNYGIIRDLENVGVRTYERGVEDETLACGTGMAATFLRAFEEGVVNPTVTVVPKSGEELQLRYENEKLFFKGRVKKVFETFKEGIW
ncbi:diaminopimelate epimerase [Nitratiruptor sp. SB155-2]|uniref:Diaminopimelate epimerase n=1 Tax=Nitratiruptor sp. (strain SB155-2) TaxID=387092 RepID=DAPF_NITSB|nr:diaminopimelate epimerase [Nitratiruptor sp. SB155-2]A6Q160.1 RecName: Full=Diaminopimelate epimerase; Short=DAP epimerase; AltName: Full=PLP-independent amino acid racemase [Nitratiruptor sp. SB155-2]BAF69219.1 diaminopimelate epimerase [Nitratiruptor sp. SB155-2]